MTFPHRQTSLTAESGQAMVEYGLILALVSITAIAVLGSIGQHVAALLTTVQNAFPAP